MVLLESLDGLVKHSARRWVMVLVGVDPIVCLKNSYCLSQSLVDCLQDYGLKTLDKFRVGCNFSTDGTYWLSASDLDLSGDWFAEWDNYVAHLATSGIQLHDEKDRLVWSFNCKYGHVIVRWPFSFLLKTICLWWTIGGIRSFGDGIFL